MRKMVVGGYLSLKADAGDYVANITRTYGAFINISVNVGGVANAWTIEGARVWGDDPCESTLNLATVGTPLIVVVSTKLATELPLKVN